MVCKSEDDVRRGTSVQLSSGLEESGGDGRNSGKDSGGYGGRHVKRYMYKRGERQLLEGVEDVFKGLVGST
jgi:hypothetical protein